MTVNLLSKNGIPLPLRAMPFRDLNREYWSRGKVVHPEKLERTEARELTAFEKTLDTASMSLDDLVATQDMELMSESRRSYLTRGAGVASLAPWDAYNEGSIGETIVDTEAQAMLEAIDDPLIESADHDARRFGVPYETVDPITAKQIAWEMEQAMTSPVTRVRLGTNPTTGKLSIATDRKMLPDELMTIARSVKRSLAAAFGTISTLDDLHARVDLIRDALNDSGVTIDLSPDWREERARLVEPLDAEWHSAYESVHPMVVYNPADPTDDQFAPCRRRCNYQHTTHGHIRVARVTHRRPKNVGAADEFWHRQLPDVTAYELGTDGLVDPLVVQL